jgi:hypothetical protein
LIRPERRLGNAATRRFNMATLDAKDREKLRKTQFAYVDKEGGEHLPVNDAAHTRNAVSRFNQTDFESRSAKKAAASKVLKAAKRFGVDVGDDTEVRKAAKG